MELNAFGVKVTIIEPNDIATTIEPDAYFPEESSYTKQSQTAYKKMKGNVKSAESATIVADLIAKLLKKDKVKPYYAIGGSANLLLALKRILPKSLVNRIIINMYT